MGHRWSGVVLLIAGMLTATAHAQTKATGNVMLLIKLWDDVRTNDVTKRNPPGATVSALGMLSLQSDKAEPVVFGLELIEQRGTAEVRVGARAGGKYTLQAWPRGEAADRFDIPIAIPADACPKGCDRDAVTVEFYRSRVEAFCRPVVFPKGSDALTLIVRPKGQ